MLYHHKYLATMLISTRTDQYKREHVEEKQRGCYNKLTIDFSGFQITEDVKLRVKASKSAKASYAGLVPL